MTADTLPANPKPGPWKAAHDGTVIHLLDPWATPIKPSTIAYALAWIMRFGGHAGGYSVAAHSLHVSALLERSHGVAGARLGLLHDAHEAYLGDLGTPIKQALRAEGCTAWDDLEHDWECRVRGVFPLDDSPELRVALREADLVALSTERRVFMPATFGPGAPSWGDVERELDWRGFPAPARFFGEEAVKAFLARGEALSLW